MTSTNMTNTSNCSVQNSLSFLFEQDDDQAVSPLTRADALALQSTPTATALLTWLVIECCCLRPSARRISTVVGCVAIAMQIVVLWRTGTVLYCDATVVSSTFVAVLMCACTAATDVAVFTCVLRTWRSPRSATAIFLVLATTTIGADWSLRGGVISSRASHLLVAVQHCFDILAVSCMHFFGCAADTTRQRQKYVTRELHPQQRRRRGRTGEGRENTDQRRPSCELRSPTFVDHHQHVVMCHTSSNPEPPSTHISRRTVEALDPLSTHHNNPTSRREVCAAPEECYAYALGNGWSWMR